jgi:uncharacterized protein YbjT (DUF2867 family)
VAENTRAKWELGRFWKTLTYFEIFPFFSCLERLLKREQKKSETQSNIDMEIILVTGATGGVGKRVVRRLLEQNYRVRALVRDSKKAREILGEKPELFEADLTIPETLNPKLMAGVSAIISCTGVRVQPIEGDTPTREKYYQGIKFYLPEVVDSPELVEYQGMRNLLALAKKSLISGEKLLFDFTQPSGNLKEIWGAVDDVVMGGVSESGIRLAGNRAVFSGNVSTANRGGFASVRTRNFNPPLDLSGYQGIELRVQGDGSRYKFIIRCEGKWDGVGYCYSFDTLSNCWMSVQIPFAELIPVFRAKTLPEAGTFDSSKVYSMQLMLSKFEYDGALNPKFSPGLFALDIESIKAYGGRPTPQLILISSAGVTRPGRPGINLEEEPPAVRLNEQLGGILTWKLRGEDLLRQSGLNYTIIRPCALTEKAADKVLIFDQGDKIKGQVSRDAIAELCLQILQLPEACNKTFEVREAEEIVTASMNWNDLLGNLQCD